MSNLSKIVVSQLAYQLPNQRIIFSDFNVNFSSQKAAIVGKNGVGKSTLLHLIQGILQPSSGKIDILGKLAVCPQNFLLYQDWTVAKVLGVDQKLQAYYRILQGSTLLEDYELLDDDWTVQEDAIAILEKLNFSHIALDRQLNTLSGGEVTQLFLFRLFSNDADILLLDEPTNNLDISAKKRLYAKILQTDKQLIIISHDRELLNLMDCIVEVTSNGAEVYTGNYDLYLEQKALLQAARRRQLHDAKKTIQTVEQKIQKTREAWSKRSAKGKQQRKRGDQPKMLLDAKKNRSGQTLKTLNIREDQLLKKSKSRLQMARDAMVIENDIRIELPKTHVPNSKIIIEIEDLTFCFKKEKMLFQNFSFTLAGPKRIAICGNNGSGKTTLIRLILGDLKPISGTIKKGTERIQYLDQKLSLFESDQTILQNYLQLNPDISERDARFHLAHFLFRDQDALKEIHTLSGGERLRAALCCVLTSNEPPQLLILDEPTNHLDLESIEALESALQCYLGALILISHDQVFLNHMNVDKMIQAPFL